MFDTYNGIPIVITTIRKQKRKHRKQRINKKWAKKYGFDEFELMPDNEAALIDGKLYMQWKVYEKLRKELQV